MSKDVFSVIWKRLDVPGHDSCCLRSVGGGYELEGMAVYVENGAAAQMGYQLRCDSSWRTLGGQVRGWLGDRRIDLAIVRADPGGWSVNGAPVAGLDHLVDLDYGFTPATNFPQLRRLALAVGEAADLPVAWIDATSSTLTPLPQRYERRSASHYWYESPTASYRAMLEVMEGGFIRSYPGLWALEPSGS